MKLTRILLFKRLNVRSSEKKLLFLSFKGLSFIISANQSNENLRWFICPTCVLSLNNNLILLLWIKKATEIHERAIVIL